MGGVSKNMTASPKTKVRPLLFSRVGDPAKRVIRNPPTLRRPSSFSPLRNLARSRVTNNAECRRRRARARARPGAERARDQGSSRVPRSAPSVSPSPRRATTRASPSSLFPPASDALPPASGKATTNLGTGDARARGDVRAPGEPPHARAGSGYPNPPARNTRAGAGASTAPAQLDPGPWAHAPKWPQNILAAAGQVGTPAPQNWNQGPVPGAPPNPSRRRGPAVATNPAPPPAPARPFDSAARTHAPAAGLSGRGSLSSNLSDLTNDSHAFRPGTFFYEPQVHHLPPACFGRPPHVVLAADAGAFPAMPPPPSVAPPREFAGARSPGGGAASAGAASAGAATGAVGPGPGPGPGPASFDRESPPRGFYVELADSPSDSPVDAAVPGSGTTAAGTTTTTGTTTTAETVTISPNVAAALDALSRPLSRRAPGTPAPWYTRLRARPSHARRAISPRRRAARSRTTCSAECKR